MKKKTIGIIVCMLLIAFTISPVASIVNDNENAEDKISSTESRKSLELTPSVYEWPMFRHDLQNIGYSTSPSPISNDLLWTFEADYVISTPAIVNERVYFGSDDDEDFFCLNADTGELIWTYPIPGGVSIASPAVYEGKVYQGTVSYNIFCWDAEDGTLIWNISKPHGGTSSAAVAEGKVYIGIRYWFYCLDAETGDELWSYAIGSEPKSCPAVYEGKVYFGTGGGNATFGTVNCLDADTGDEIWIYNTTGVFASPVIFNDKVYIGSWYSYSYGIFHCLDADTGEVLWNYTAGPISSSAAVAYGNVYYVCGSGKVKCLDADTGDVQWNYTVSSSYEHCYSSPAVADGRVYVGIWSSGDLLCLDAYTGELIWDYPAGTPVWLFQSPAIANGRVYFGGDDNNILYCFGPEYYPPQNPIIDGPDNGTAGIDYNYTFVATDPFDYGISYMVNWGDGIVSNWTGPFPSNVTISLSHNWSISGNYSITVKVKNIHVQSTWSDPFNVSIIPSGPPPQPSNPQPPDGATNVDVNANLVWECNENCTYNVYFEADDPTPDVLVSENQTQKMFDPGKLNYTTIYYWKIVAWNMWGNTSGSVWNFTTEVNVPPYPPNDPFPPDEATDVDINANLSWVCGDPDGDPITYDVYYGDSSPPPKVVSNQSETIYDPGTMDYSTQYYWKIVAWDNLGLSASGPVWNFTTTSYPNEPPYIPSDPDPENGSTNVDIDADLSWTGGDPDENDTVFYDVYLEADDPTPDIKVADDISEIWFDPGTLEYSTTYYWQIIARDNHFAVTEGPIWHFTTETAPEPDLSCDGSLSWTDVKPGDTVTGNFTVENIGSGLLDWEITDEPGWGTWSFDPDSGDDMAPGAPLTVDVTVIAPDDKNEEFSGRITLENKENSGDVCYIDVSLATPRNKAFISNFPLICWLLERFPILQMLLDVLMANLGFSCLG